MEAVIVASIAAADNPHRKRQYAVGALRVAAQDVGRNQVGTLTKPRFAYTNSGGTRILKDVRQLKEQVTSLTEAFKVEREHAQKESEVLRQQLQEILGNQRSVGTKWDWAVGPLHGVAIAIRCRFIKTFYGGRKVRVPPQA